MGYIEEFQSTLPVRGVTVISDRAFSPIFISIHTPREGSDLYAKFTLDENGISIHTPREGSDSPGLGLLRFCGISIHTPREGSDFPGA